MSRHGFIAEFVDDSLSAVDGVLGVHHSYEDHECSAVGEGLFDEFSGLSAGVVVVGADVTEAVTLGGVGVLSDDVHRVTGFVDYFGLVGRIDGAHGDAGDAFGDEALEHALLFFGGSGGRHEELAIDVEFNFCLFDSCAGDLPEV